MNHYLYIFLVGFGSVFAAGFQSRNVNHGNYGWAAMTAFAIGLSNAFLWTAIVNSGGGFAEAMVYSLSGALAITSSMYVHHRFILNGRGLTLPAFLRRDKKLRKAALDLYRAGHWSRPAATMENGVKVARGLGTAPDYVLWERLRDALGLPPGSSRYL